MSGVRPELLTPPSIYRILLLDRLSWRMLIVLVGLIGTVAGISAPYFQKRFIDGLIASEPLSIWIWAAFVTTVLAHGCTQLNLLLATSESVRAQRSLSEALYEKMVRIRGGIVGSKPVGEAVSVYAVDVPGAAAILDQVLAMAISVIFPIVLAPLALKHFFSIPLSASWGILGTLAAVNFVLAVRQSRFFNRFKALAAERTGLVSEWVQNIRALRILGWTESAEGRIFAVRKQETTNRVAMVTNGQMMNTISGSSTFLLNLMAVALLVKLHGDAVTPGELLALLWVMGVFLARPMRQFPWVFVMAMDAITSVKRLNHAFKQQAEAPRLRSEHRHAAPDPELALEVRDLNLTIDGTKILHGIDLEFRPGELVGIIGEVGSGKSLLLHSLLGETAASFRTFAVDGKQTGGPLDPGVRDQFTFVPQEGFTMSATLRENVHFDYEVSRDRDTEVIDSLSKSQFDPIEEGVRQGLDEEIGERGVNLSGGQRQRVSLARAHYAGRPIVLLDDSLSAVDVETERKLVSQLIEGEWSERLRILATHRMSVLPRCDRILMMESGRIVLEGTFEDLIASSDRFRNFVKTAAKTRGLNG